MTASGSNSSHSILVNKLLGKSGNLGTAGLTIASIGTVYALTQKLIDASFTKFPADSSENVPELPVVQNTKGLPTVMEGVEDDSDGATATATTASVALKKSSRRPILADSLTRNLEVLASLVGPDNRAKYTALVVTIITTVFGRSLGDVAVYNLTSQIDELVSSRPVSVFEKPVDKQSVLSNLVTKFLLLGIPLSILHQVQNYASASLSGSIRRNLTEALMKRLVLSPHNLSHPEELVDANRLDALMGDVTQASILGVQLGSERLRRYTDIVVQMVLLVKLTRSVKIPLIMLMYLALTVSVVARQKMFKTMFNKKISQSESVLKKYLTRLSRHRDSIAAWDGAPAELHKISTLSGTIESARKTRDRFEFLHSLCSSLCSRVGGTALGFLLIGLHFLSPKSQTERPSLLEYFWTGRVMLQLCNSFSSVVEEDVLLKATASDSPATSNVPLVRLTQMIKRLKASLVDLPNQLPPPDQLPYRVRKTNMSVSDVTALSPEGNILFQSMSFEITPGSIVLVQGPKGVGKTALLRLMIGTWPAVMGEVSRPKSGVYCVLSKPYLLSDASLKDQISYPDCGDVDNERLTNAVRIARISHLFEKEARLGASLMTEQDQQKLMIARLVYHRPRYALLDDCFKALDLEHFASIINYLASECQCGVVIACQSTTAESLKNLNGGGTSKLKFNLEVILSSNKQSPRHEIIMSKST